ncbi:hypothetical protein [Gymnodinialimonas hymeniacidonis]|uniref:hypothetical protein n=1 Tax=Gymnodinialimonas hymeniacidonis TaxID=3126508 RepID=UPI0034C62BDC
MTSYLRFSNAMTIGFLIVVLWHFGTVFGLFGVAPSTQTEMFVRLGVIIGVTIVTSFAGALVMQKRQGAPLLPDEREEKIERQSEGIGVLTIYVGLLVLAWLAFAPLNPIQFVNGILAVVAVTELAKLLVVLFLHRREIG